MMKQNHYDKILSAAVTIFHERGFHDSSTQDVVDLAGVSKGSFYNHFKSKETLGLAVLDVYWESYADSLRLLRAPDQPPLKRIDNYFKSIAYDDKGCLVGNFSTELSASDRFSQRLSELFKTWTIDMAACIADGQKDGTIRDNQSAMALAEFVISAFEGTIARATVERDPSVLERFRETTLTVLASK